MRIQIDRETFDVFESFYRPRGFKELPPGPTATGEEIRRIGDCVASARIDALYPDGRERPVADREAVALVDGMAFISVPTATY